MKKIIITLIVIIGIVVFFVISRLNKNEVVQDGTAFSTFCYYQETKLENGLKDTALLRVENTSERTGISTLRGEYQNIPAEKDSKKGFFAGEYGVSEDAQFLRSMSLLQSEAEGIKGLEEFAFMFNPEEVRIGFGELQNRGDGVYIYTDRDTINFSQILPAVPCEELNERMSVDAYVRQNIGTISDVPPVLGGSWYVVSLDVNQKEKKGSIVYEDGHIQETRNFSYTFQDGVVEISLVAQETASESQENSNG